LTFQDAQLRLVAYVRDRIRNGELTERAFARQIGISQPHAHNVLKGIRNLSPEILDIVLRYFHLSLLDLAPEVALEANLQQRRARERLAEVPFLESPIGPGLAWPGLERRRRFTLPFPYPTVPLGWVVAKLAADPQMQATLADSDIALLETSESRRANRVPQGLYVVARRGEAVLRYIRTGAYSYYLVTDTNMGRPLLWEHVAQAPGEFLASVKARVHWLGREQDSRLPASQPGRFLYEPTS
jgi:transcriptional regulator with XRE-family HTH domain